MLKNYMEVVSVSEFLKAWDGKRGKMGNVKIQTTNSNIAKGQLDKAINTSLVKQVYQYDNKAFNKIMNELGGFHIQHKLTEILFYKENGNYYISSLNKKTQAMVIYPLDNEVDKETDKAIEIPLKNLQELIFNAEIYR